MAVMVLPLKIETYNKMVARHEILSLLGKIIFLVYSRMMEQSPLKGQMTREINFK